MPRVIVLCAVLLLASCGGGDSDNTASNDTATTETRSPETTAAPTTAADEPTAATVVAVDADPCTLITTAEVEEATGLTVAEVVAEGATTCVFDLGADAGVDIFIRVDDGQGVFTAPSNVYADYAARVGDGEAEAIAGLGAGAIYDSGFRAIAVDAGDGRFFVVGVNGGYQALDDPCDALVALGEAALGRL